jgi:hypothetical protein
LQSGEEREVLMQSVVVGVDDVVGDEDDETGDKVVVDKEVEGCRTDGDPEGSC